MPIVHVRVPEGVFDPAAIQRLGADVTKAAADAERVPKDPSRRKGTWVLIDEVRSTHWFAAGASDVTREFIPAVATIYPPAGVLDRASCEEFAASFDEAVKAAASVGETRPILTACVIADVPEGRYGVMGRIFSLGDFVTMAGYEHLQAAG